MKLRRAWIGPLAALAAALAAGPAHACFFDVGNDYLRMQLARSHVADLARAAATIDWVAIDAPPPAACPRIDRRLDDAQLQAAYGAACWETFKGDYEGPRLALTARVIESLKGRSETGFVIRAAMRTGPRALFADQRTGQLWHQVDTVVSHRQAAQGGHKGLALWDRGVLYNSAEPSYCPGENALDPRLRYLAFRDAKGGVLALEPVTRGDDALLQRLRATRGEGAIAPTATFRQALSRSRGAVLVEIESCRRRRDWGGETIQVRALSPTSELSFEDMDMMAQNLAALGTPCRVGLRMLVLRKPFADEPFVAPDRADLIAAVPDWKDDFTLEPHAYQTVGEPLRVLPVRNGAVLPRDLITGLKVTGEPLPVETALRLAGGRPARDLWVFAALAAAGAAALGLGAFALHRRRRRRPLPEAEKP